MKSKGRFHWSLGHNKTLAVLLILAILLGVFPMRSLASPAVPASVSTEKPYAKGHAAIVPKAAAHRDASWLAWALALSALAVGITVQVSGNRGKKRKDER